MGAPDLAGAAEIRASMKQGYQFQTLSGGQVNSFTVQVAREIFAVARKHGLCDTTLTAGNSLESGWRRKARLKRTMSSMVTEIGYW
jgi:hypothetical protein